MQSLPGPTFTRPPSFLSRRASACAPLAGSALLALLLSGCSSVSLDVPRADNYPASDQKLARSVHHWDVLADDVANRVVQKISAWPAGQAYPIHVEVAVPPGASSRSSFQNGFRQLLITRLVDKGVEISTQPTAIALKLETQQVQHRDPISSTEPSPWTRLAAGVGVARDWQASLQSAALGTVADLTQYTLPGPAVGGPARTELLITTSLESGDRYLARTADIYFIESSNALLYLAPPQPVPPPPPTPVKNWQVVAP
jgi:hypothetical protein